MQLATSTWREVEAYLTRCDGIVVPIGSIEQHGPTGLIGTDTVCAEAVARGIGEAGGFLVGPAIPFGAAQFNLAFPGTISARATTLMALVTDYARSLARGGFRRIFVVNGHGGNVAPVRAAFHDLHGDASLGGAAALQLRLRNWWDYPTADSLRRELYGDREGMHATPSEVAITMALYPDRVRPEPMAPADRLPASFLRDHAGDDHPDAERHRARFPDGRVGSEPNLAEADHGRRLLTAAVADGVAEVRSFFAVEA